VIDHIVRGYTKLDPNGSSSSAEKAVRNGGCAVHATHATIKRNGTAAFGGCVGENSSSSSSQALRTEARDAPSCLEGVSEEPRPTAADTSRATPDRGDREVKGWIFQQSEQQHDRPADSTDAARRSDPVTTIPATRSCRFL